LVVLVVAVYGGTYGYSFASEDFILLGRLAQSSLVEVFGSEISGPWLGLGHVNFYRPFAMVLLAGEVSLFGLNPFPFHLAHVALHGVNAFLVLWIVSLLTNGLEVRNGEGDRWLPLAVAVLFALYPLHPSAVLFVGSFATLWGATFQLISLGCFLRFVLTGRKRPLIGSLATFLLALGCYEAAAVLPAVMVSGGLMLRPDSGKTSSVLRRSWVGVLPFASLLVAYLLVRKMALGVILGGYPSFRARWFERVGRMVADFLASLPRLVLPDMERAPSLGLLVLIVSGSLILVAVLLAKGILRKGRLVLLGLAWAAVFQLPFSFTGVVPANGRFWYLPSFAIALALCTLLREVSHRVMSQRETPSTLLRKAWLIPILGLALVYSLLLRRDLGAYQVADQQVQGVQQAVLDQAGAGQRQVPLLLAGLPEFTTNGRGMPVAKVFQFGTHDAVLPPFLQAETEVFPVPAFVARDRLVPLAVALGGRSLVWDEDRLLLHPPARRATADPAIEVSLRGMGVHFRCPECLDVRLFAVTRGGAFRGDAVEGAAEVVALPEAFLRGMGGLYGGSILWWLEGEKALGGGRVVSEIQRVETSELFPGLALRFGSGPGFGSGLGFGKGPAR